MTFEKGKMNFSVLISETSIGERFEESIIEESYHDSSPTIETPVEDFTAGMSLADAPQDRDSFRLGSHFYAAVRKKSLKMPRSQVKEKTTLAIHQATIRNAGMPLDRKQKKEIKEMILEGLEDEAQIELAGSRFVLCNDRKRVLVEATSAKKLDDALIAITNAVALDQVKGLCAYTPEFLYGVATGENPDAYEPLTIAGRFSSEGIGRDFLTWLWAKSSTRGQIGDITVALTGTIQLAGEDDGTGPVTVILKDGAPAVGAEVNASLKQGKKVSKAEFSIADKELVYNVVIDDEFTFKGFIGPYEKEPGIDDGSLFDGRIYDCVSFLKVLERAFKAFCKDVKRQEEVDNWVESRLVSTKR